MPDEALICEFSVPGKPEPRGSKQGFALYKDKRRKIPLRRPDGSIIVNVVDSNDGPSTKWMHDVRLRAGLAFKRPMVEDAALDVVLVFYVHRPDTHYGTGRNLRWVKESAPARPSVRPDVDKLARPVLDALTDLVWKDDGQIVGLSVDVYYAVPKSARESGEGVVVRVGYAEQQTAADLDLDLRERWIPPGDGAPAEGEITLAV